MKRQRNIKITITKAKSITGRSKKAQVSICETKKYHKQLSH